MDKLIPSDSEESKEEEENSDEESDEESKEDCEKEESEEESEDKSEDEDVKRTKDTLEANDKMIAQVAALANKENTVPMVSMNKKKRLHSRSVGLSQPRKTLSGI